MKPLQLVRIIPFAALLGVFPLLAATLEEGIDLYQEGYWAEALRIWLPLAEQGDEQAQLFLSEVYLTGRGAEADPEKARQWLQRSAEQGFAPAQFNLGNYYQQGQGGAVDYAKAAHWWRKAAEQGFVRAQYNLGYMHASGNGVKRDEAKARYWYGQAAANGLERAREALAQLGPEEGAAQAEEPSIDAASEPAGSWVGRQPADHYTIQLLAVSQPDNCLSSAREVGQQLSETVHPFHYRIGDARYCALLLGRFPDPGQARERLTTLPPSLQKNKPWIRRFDQLQALSDK